MNDVAAVIPSSWFLFGLSLEIESERLKVVGADNPQDQLLCFAEVYSIWKRENCKPVTWDVVIKILESNMLQNKALARKLREKYGVP